VGEEGIGGTTQLSSLREKVVTKNYMIKFDDGEKKKTIWEAPYKLDSKRHLRRS